MEQPLLSPLNRYGSAFSALVSTSLVVGTLDAAAAVLLYEIRPFRLFQFIASGIFGREALVGGLWMALWGLVFHFLLAFSWTLFYFTLYPKIKILSRSKIISGLIYGFLIWVVMNLLVLPLTRIPQSPFDVKQAIIGISILMITVGLPITTLTHRYYSGKLDIDKLE